MTPAIIGATVTGNLFNWTPATGQATGSPYSITFTATDNGGLSNSKTVIITVNKVNVAPVLTKPNDTTISENISLSFTLSATDTNGDPLTYSMTSTPDIGNVLTGNQFSWTPTTGQASGSPYSITFTVTDIDGLTDSKTMLITVNPTAHFLAARFSGYIGDSVTLPIRCTDTAAGGYRGAIDKIYLGWKSALAFDDSIPGSAAMEYVYTNMFPPGTWTVRVKAVDGEGRWSDTDSAEGDVFLATGVNTLVASAVDGKGNWSEKRVSIYSFADKNDSLPPVLLFKSPAHANDTVNMSPFTIKVTARIL